MSNLSRKLMMGAAGAAGEALGIEDVFSTYLYTGTGSTQTITNGIDLAGKGGMVWIKNRNISYGENHALYDSERGIGSNLVYKDLSTDSTASQQDRLTVGLSSFNNDGFTVIGNNAQFNTSPNTYASWTFRKAPGFFDVVTYTGNGSNRTISHNLGSVPGCMIIKRTDTTGNWVVYHQNIGASPAASYYLWLQTTDARGSSGNYFNDTAPTSSVFTVGVSNDVNASGGTYVAYLFAHDEQIFGEGGDQSVIKCGSYTGNGSATGPVIDLGWEPQWVMIKNASATGNWFLFDTMRGIPIGAGDEILYADLANAANTAGNILDVNATGFQITATGSGVNTSSNNYIYIAIRRGPMKTPTDATKVFNTVAATNNAPWFKPGFPVDWGIGFSKTTTDKYFGGARLTGQAVLNPNANGTWGTASSTAFDYNNGFHSNSTASSDYMSWSFRRAPGFFDVVSYKTTGGTLNVSHSLGVVPELMIVKVNVAGSDWPVYAAPLGNTQVLYTNFTSSASTSFASWDSTTPTSSVFTVGNNYHTNQSSGYTAVAFLFASLDGVSKVGSYTGTGTTLQINCGFTNGARLVIIKRTDSTGSWYVWDTARGIVSGNDPYLLLNSTAAEVTSTDYIDPLSSGFQISSTAPAEINASGGSYIFLAVA